MKTIKKCAERLKLEKKAFGYWDLHIRVDRVHGQWVLNDVAIPLVKDYNELAYELLWGYDQQKFMSCRGAQAIVYQTQELEKVVF